MASPRVVKIEISPEVRSVLERSEITDNSLRLPPEQLHRELYVSVDKVLKAAGGKWSRSGRVHQFEGDPRAALGLALKEGGIVDKKRSNEQFYTPDAVADRLVALLRLGSVHPTESQTCLLEPSAGDGAVCRAVRRADKSVHITAVEIEKNQVLEKYADEVFWGDFVETYSPFKIHCGDDDTNLGPFEYIVANFPFRPAAEHACHAFSFLVSGGRMAAIVPPNILEKGGKNEKRFRELHALYGVHQEALPPGTFKESGTNVGGLIIVWEKR